MSDPYTPADNYVALNWTTAVSNAYLDGDIEEQKLLIQNIDRQAAPGIIILMLPFFLKAMHGTPEHRPESPESDRKPDGEEQ